MPKRQQARYLVEGLRRMGPLWSCFAGTPPSFHGKPDAYYRIQKLGREAYPDLVIAMADRRDAGRHLSAGGEGLPCTVGYVAHGPDPEKTIPALLANAPELKRIAYIEALAWLASTNQADPDTGRILAIHLCAQHLGDKSHNVALSAAWVLHRLSNEAFASDHGDGLRMIELARAWAREQKLIR